jgi:hypothetical protein
MAITWAQRLKRVFRIDVETCQACGGAVRIIASIEDPAVIGKISAHVGEAEPVREVVRLPGPRALPEDWFGEFTYNHARMLAQEGAFRVICGRSVRAWVTGR